MYDTQKHFDTFYKEHVCLGQERRGELAAHRNACLKLLGQGLRRLGEKRRRPDGYPQHVDALNQGSYDMRTLNQHPQRQYDIDVAVIFRKEDLPKTALRARQRVAEALRSSLQSFATKPLARTSAVTVWYTRGEHVDLAIYRQVTDSDGKTVLEHASAQWRRRDPKAVSEWFSRQNQCLSPDPAAGASVRESQFRRIVRLVKTFARSRVSWDLPGGMILSTLVAEVYQPDLHRDDLAFYKTLIALRERLKRSPEVRSPVADDESLTSSPRRRAQVGRLIEKLDFVLPQLEVLQASTCLKVQALTAWWWVFNHDYWREQARNARLLQAREAPALLRVRAALASSKGGEVTAVYKDKTSVPKGAWLRFSLKKKLGIPAPFTVRWRIQNRGSEALHADEVQREHVSEDKVLWQKAAYSGRHSLTCEVIKDGFVVARGIRHVRIG
ncbi:nucleotide-binding domain-containing protein [Pyxidicoccus sp. MSG2]|uniref:nucleotide-binding domain-containing protein n=1 Tax=Pyxidicoccus sp. MSG2 TaxID=2996790 RepID=UPI0022705162|nr:hypothetical protein [Pyxidicoccus sp. MSG2]MCY1018630.1 hypothetical protein [Pyxidicoccus sp. MSG2]